MQQQYYPTTVPRHGGTDQHHVYHPGSYIHPAAARMQWSPNVQGGQWAATYDISGSYPGFVPSSMAGIHSPDPAQSAAATPHNIRDILGPGGQQTSDTLQSEIAKTPSSYQKSPSSAGAATGGGGTVFHYPTPVSGGDMRSPTTNNPAEIPQFYIPALQGKPFVGFDPTAITPDNMHGIPAGLAYYTGAVDPKSGAGDKMVGSSGKDGKKEKKGRATFSGNQIDELEKVFSTNQYLTNQERHNLAERLQLSENQVKIWFQNRRTKCRRTSWKRTPSVTSPTTPTAPVSFSNNTPTTPTHPNPPPPVQQPTNDASTNQQ